MVIKNDLPKKNTHSSTLTLLAFFVFISTWSISQIIYPYKYAAHDFLANNADATSLPLEFVASTHFIDLLLLSSALILFIFLGWIQTKKEALSELLSSGDEKKFIFILLLLAILLSNSYFEPGILITGDSNAHVARVAHFSRSIISGEYTGWSNYFYAGTPVFEFTGPLFFWIAGLLDSFLQDPDLSSKVIVLISTILSGVLFYLFTRALFASQFSALAGSLIYGFSFAHIHLVFFRGSLPQSIIFLAVPALFYSITKVVNSKTTFTPWFFILALSVFVAFLSHPTSAVFLGISAIIFVAALMLFGFITIQDFIRLVFSSVLGLLLSAPSIVPIFLESEWVVMGSAPSSFSVRLPSASELMALFSFRDSLTGSQFESFIAYTAYCLVGFSLAWLFSATSQNKYRMVTFTFIAILTASLVIQIPYFRNIVFILFSISTLSAIGIQHIEKIWNDGKLAILCVLVIELFFCSVYPLARTDKNFVFNAAESITEHFSESRVILAGGESHSSIGIPIGPNGGILARYDMLKLDGPHNITVPKTHNFIATVLLMAEADLKERGALTAATLKALCINNVAALISIREDQRGLPENIAGTEIMGNLGNVLRLNCATPILATPTLEVISVEETLKVGAIWGIGDKSKRISDAIRHIVNHFTLTNNGIIAEQIPVNEKPQDYVAYTNPISVDLLNYHVSRNQVGMTLNVQGKGYLRIAHPWFPTVKVLINDNQATPIRSTMENIVVKLDSGINEILIFWHRSELRNMLQEIGSIYYAVFALSFIISFFARSRATASV